MSKVALMIMLGALAACSHSPSTTTPPDISARQAALDSAFDASLGPAEKLSFRAMPPIHNGQVKAGIINFSSVAKAWWIGMRCPIATAEENRDFKNRLEQLTPMMQATLQNEFKTTPELANKYTQTITMYALEEMSANQFYGCGPQAKQIWSQGYFITKVAIAKAGETLVFP